MAPAMASSNLPLHCNICPKKPNFSDVSHLLTHIASKGHLSHYYKAKVRSSNDQTAKHQVDIYDEWYAHWNVEELMSERMHHKDKKRSTRARGQASITKAQKKTTNSTDATPLDPLLGNGSKDCVSYEPTQELFDDSLFSRVGPSPPAKLHRPKLHWWSTNRPSSYSANCIDYSSSPPIHFGSKSSNDTITKQTQATPVVALHTLDGGVDEEDEETAEAAKLKGVFWPGMNLFDSATPDMKKKRNQRKDVSVVEQLEQNSQVVEPTEMIFYQTGNLKKQRKISGRVESSSSPSQSPQPSPPLPQPRRRQPMTNRDINTSRIRPPPRASAASQMATQYLPAEAVMTSAMDQMGKPLRGGISGAIVPKRKRQFSVFNDDENQRFGNPTGMDCLTSEFRYEPSENRAQQRQPQSQPPPVQFTNPGTTYNNSQYHESFMPFQPYQTFYAPPQYNMYGPAGYDLAALLTNHLQQAANEAERSEDQPDRRNRKVEQDTALTISDSSNG